MLDRVVEDVRAGLEEIVDRAGDVFLVARDRARADDHRVAGLDLDEPVVAVGHPREAGHRLALGAGRGDHQLVRSGIELIASLATIMLGGYLEVAEVGRDPGVLLHRPADDGDLAIERPGRVDDLLDARDVAGEGRDDHPAVERLHDLAERLAHRPLRRACSRGSRRASSRDRRQTTPSSPSLREDVEVRQLAVDRACGRT